MTLEFSPPTRQRDGLEQYFSFKQNAKNTNYNIQWTSNETFVVPDDVLTSIIEEFLQFASSFFVKPPSVESMKKHVEHKMLETDTLVSMKNSDDTYECVLFPCDVSVYSKKTVIGWWFYNRSIIKKPDEQIPSDFLAESRPSSPTGGQETKNVIITSDPVSNAILEAVADIPLQEDNSGGAFRLDDDAEERMFRLRILEAKLSAKIAKYKARKEEERYYSKFGRPPPDEDSYDGDETDYETEDDEI